MNKNIRRTPITDKKALLREGSRLWNDATLGKSGLSCNTCHPDGAGLNRVSYPRYIEMAQDIVTLDQMINFCMINPMDGKPLKWNSAEMTAIAAYVMEYAKEGGKSKNGDSVNPCAANPCSKK